MNELLFLWGFCGFLSTALGNGWVQTEVLDRDADWRVRVRAAFLTTIGAAAWPVLFVAGVAWGTQWLARKLAVYATWEVSNALAAIKRRYPRLARSSPAEVAGPFRSLPGKCEACGRFKEVSQ